MAVYYELQPLDETHEEYFPDASRCMLVPISAEQATQSTNSVVEVISPEAFDELDLLSEVSNDFLDSLVESESNFVDVYADHLMGSFSVPDKNDLLGDLDTFAFYANRHYLIFSDDSGVAESVLKTVASMGVVGADTTIHCLYVFIRQMLVDEIDFMVEMEKAMEKLEEGMLENDEDVSTITIMRYRRQSMKLADYYDQVGTMTAVLAANESKLMSPEEAQSFANISSFCERLVSRGESLENYSLQIHELNQTRIDLAQNSIMQTLTIVTVIIAPMSVVTGWFGMNISVPFVNLWFMWIVLLVLGIAFSLGLVWFFRRHKWL